MVNKAEVDVFLELSCFFHDPHWNMVYDPFNVLFNSVCWYIVKNFILIFGKSNTVKFKNKIK